MENGIDRAENGMAAALPNVQMLRGIAALMVVVYHASGNTAEWGGGPRWEAGQAGVDVFFVISGLVMAISARKAENRNWRHFALRRIARIVPIYWLATSVKFAAVLTGAYLVGSQVDWVHALCSYLFIPHRWGTGGVYPLLFVGWTLSFEMFFYLLFAIALALRTSIVGFLTVVIVMLSVVGIYRPGEWPDATTLFHPILFEFLLGVWIGRNLKSGLQIHPGVAWPLIAFSFVMICVAPVDLTTSWSRVVWWGIPGAVLVAVAAHFRAAPSRFWVVMGDASYSTYLWHGFVVSAAAIVLGRLTPSLPVEALWLVSTVAACALGGYLIYRWVEKPLTDFSRVRRAPALGGHTARV
jgi:exopolysaccharide production protein ExoZ